MCATCTLLRSWRIIKNVKYFEVMLNIFDFIHVLEILESWMVYANNFLWIAK